MSISITRKPFRLVLVTVFLFASSCLGQETLRSEQTAVNERSRYELMVRHARTNLELAEVELKYALATNAQTPSVIPEMTIERLRSNLAVAQEQFQEAELASVGGVERVRLRHAEEKIRLAKLDLETGPKRIGDGGLTKLELQRLQLRYELAKLNLALLKNPENFVTLLDYLQDKVDQMGEQILALDQRLSKLEPLR